MGAAPNYVNAPYGQRRLLINQAKLKQVTFKRQRCRETAFQFVKPLSMQFQLFAPSGRIDCGELLELLF